MRVKLIIALLAIVTLFACAENGQAQTISYVRPAQNAPSESGETGRNQSVPRQYTQSSRRQNSAISGDIAAVNGAPAVKRDSGNIPVRDATTSPLHQNLSVDKAVSRTSGNMLAAPPVRVSNVRRSPDYAAQPRARKVLARIEAEGRLAPEPVRRVMVGQPMIQGTFASPVQTERGWVAPYRFETACSPPTSNFFGVNEDECCDEWDGFWECEPTDYDRNCGGLKANPGHYGHKWQAGNAPCESAKGCRCKRRK
jgi:hypothetical protein